MHSVILLCYGYCLCGALNFAGPANNACIIVDDYRFLSFVSLDFLIFEYGHRAYVNADRVAIALLQINYDADQDLTPKVEAVRADTVISSWFPWLTLRPV